MNPLNRKMFRQPGMSRQPMGILASSPELANVVRRRTGQPVQMAHGGYHPPGDPMGRLSTSRRPVPGSVRIPLIDLLPKSGFARPALDTFMAAAGDDIPSTGIGAIRGKAQQDALTDLAMQSIRRGGSPFGDDDGSRQMSDAERMAANRASLAALRGSVGQDALTDQAMSAIAAGGSPRDGIEAIDPRITDNIAALTALRGKTRADALSDEAMAQMRPDPSATTNPNILPAMPDESSGLGVMGEDPTGLPFGIEKPFIAGEAAKPKGGTGAGGEKAPFEDLPLGEFEGIGPQEDKPLPKQGRKKGDTELQDDPTLAPPKEAEPQKDPVTDLLPEISNILDDKEASTKKKADAVDEALNIKGTRKERTEQRYQMLKELLGEDKAKDIRTDAGYNLMMTGLMIAAGQSGDAMTNIATGLAKGLAGYGEAAGEAAKAATKEEKALKLMAAKEVGDEITAEKAAQIRARELAEERDFRGDLAADKIQAQKEIAAMPGDTQRLIESMAKGSGKTPLEIYLQTKAGTSTDTDDLTISIARRYPELTTDEARILASNLKGSTSEFGSIDAAIKAMFGIDVSKQGQGQNNKVVVNPSDLKQK